MLRCILALLIGILGFSREARTYRIATTPWMGWAFLDVADAKGFWKEQGLEVQLKSYSDGTSYLDAQLAGLVDFSCAMVGDIVWIHTHRAPVRILMETDWSFGGDKFFIRKGKSLQALQGKPLGFYQARYSLPFFLKKSMGPTYRQIQSNRAVVFAPEDLVAQFKAGRIDLGVLCEPYTDNLGPQAEILFTSATHPGSLPEGFFAFREILDGMPARDLEALMQGILRAMAWMQTPGHEEELFRIVQGRSFAKYPLRDMADMRLQMKHAPVHTKDRLRLRNTHGQGLEVFLQELKDFLRESDPQGSHYQPTDLFNPAWTARQLKGWP